MIPHLMLLFYSLLKCSFHFLLFSCCSLFFLFLFKCIYLFLFVWLCWVLVEACGIFLLWHVVSLFWHAGFSLVVMCELQSSIVCSTWTSGFGTWISHCSQRAQLPCIPWVLSSLNRDIETALLHWKMNS